MLISGLQPSSPVTRTHTRTAEANAGDRFDFKKDSADQATWLGQECRARFGCTPNELMKGPEGFARFNQLAVEWRASHPRD